MPLVFTTWVPAEIALKIAAEMGADATPGDWAAVRRVSRAWRRGAGAGLRAWLLAREGGQRFGPFEGTKEELGFVRDHVQGKWRWRQCRGLVREVNASSV